VTSSSAIQSGQSPTILSTSLPGSDPPMLCFLVPHIIVVSAVVLVSVDLRPPICQWGGSGMSAAQRLRVSADQVWLAK
jgi:hypothetical protein